jgi:hypothetical protein
MSFLWSRQGDVIHSRCTLCDLVLASRLDRDIHAGQRAHSWQECQQRRLDAARAISLVVEDDRPTHCRNDHEYTPENTRVDADGIRHCQTCAQAKSARQNEARRWARAARHGAESCCDVTVLSGVMGVADGKIVSAKTNRPTRERRTVLSTPSATNGKEAVDS